MEQSVNDLPWVTFLIAHHNYEQYLPASIKSARSQDYPNINICVIDDSSTDINKVITIINKELFDDEPCHEFVQDNNILIRDDHPNFMAIYLLNGPYKQGYARNRGIELMLEKTDVFAILDADDIAKPNKISTLISPIIEFPASVGAVYGDYDTIHFQNGRTFREYKEVFDPFKLVYECIVHSGSLIPKHVLLNTKENGHFFDEDLPPLEDYDMWIRIAEKYTIVHIPESLSIVGVHPTNSTNTTTNEHRIKQLQKIHQKRIDRHNG